MIDLHCHILPGVDDGPADTSTALALAAAAAAGGTGTVVATPHVSWDWPGNDAARIGRAVEDLARLLDAEGIALDVRRGAEVAVTRALDLDDAELDALKLGGGPWLLLEPPLTIPGAGLEQAFREVAERGHDVVIAHPERAPAFQRDAAMLERLIDAGMLCQVTAASLAGRFGRDVQRFGDRLLGDGLVHVVASDAHAPAGPRSPAVTELLAARGMPVAWQTWFAEEVPAALLAGAPLPPAPSVPLDRARRRRFGRR